MTREELAAIKERVDNATPGPWDWSELWGSVRGPEKDDEAVIEVRSGELWAGEADKAFLLHARGDVLALLAEVERLRELLWEYHAALR